ncbi:hypothetical protein J6590_064319 [Homalodisca vitripennis]|nr:hypothetical protein J6590_064319 [Homalodisca vitripennis]
MVLIPERIDFLRISPGGLIVVDSSCLTITTSSGQRRVVLLHNRSDRLQPEAGRWQQIVGKAPLSVKCRLQSIVPCTLHDNRSPDSIVGSLGSTNQEFHTFFPFRDVSIPHGNVDFCQTTAKSDHYRELLRLNRPADKFANTGVSARWREREGKAREGQQTTLWEKPTMQGKQSLSPQQQSQILNDVQQHRFQLTSAQRHLQNLQQNVASFNQPPQESHPPAIEQSLGLGQQPFLTNAQYLAQIRQQQQQQQQHQQQQQQQQRQQQFNQQSVPQQRPPSSTLSAASSPPVAFQQQGQQSNPVFQQPGSHSQTNVNLRNQFQQEYNRLLSSQQFANQLYNQNLNEEIPVFFPPQNAPQHQQTYEFEPAPPTNPTKINFKFEPAPAKPTYKFEPDPPKPTYKFEPAPPKPTYKFEPVPPKPTYKFESAPPKPTYKFETSSSKPNYKFEPAPTKPPYKFENDPTFLPTQPTTRRTTYNYLKKKKAALTTTTTPATTTFNIPYRLRYKYKTTTESPKPQVSIRPTQLFIKPDRQKLFQQLIEAQQKQASTPPSPPNVTPRHKVLEFESEDELQKHIRQQLQKQGLLDEIKGTIPATSDQIDALPNLDFLSSANSSSPIYLPNGQNIKIIQVPSKIDPSSKKPTPQIKTIVINQPTSTTTTTTVKPPELLLKELTRGLPGDFEIIRQTQDGGLEELGNVPQELPQKKVTFVILEEQADGTLKVQGVRGNENNPKEGNGDVDSIIKKIEKGEIKLPKSTKVDPDQPTYSNSLANATPEESVESPSYVKHSGKPVTKFNTFQPTPSPNFFESSTKPNYNFNFRSTKTTTSAPFFQSARTPDPTLPTFNTSPNTHAGPVFSYPSSPGNSISPEYHATTPRAPSKSASFLPTVPSDFGDASYSTNTVVPTHDTTTFPPPPSVSTTSQYSQVNISPQNSYDDQLYKQIYQQNSNAQLNNVYQSNKQFNQDLPEIPFSNDEQEYQPESVNQQADVAYTTSEPLPIQQVNHEAAPSPAATGQPALVDVLRSQGLYAMSKFLRQSGLDTILNATGKWPYTVFVPTDRAFRALLVQLGGPDKAEEKFQENPRLLSGVSTNFRTSDQH